MNSIFSGALCKYLQKAEWPFQDQRASCPEIFLRDHNVARFCLFRKILKALEIVKCVLSHLLYVGDGQVAVMEDHVSINVIFWDNPDVAFNNCRPFGSRCSAFGSRFLVLDAEYRVPTEITSVLPGSGQEL